jgi:hypothetical protein
MAKTEDNVSTPSSHGLSAAAASLSREDIIEELAKIADACAKEADITAQNFRVLWQAGDAGANQHETRHRGRESAFKEIAYAIRSRLPPAAAVEAPGAEDVTTCFECSTPLRGPYCPSCNPSPSILEGQEPVAWLCRLEDGEFVTLEEPDYGSFPVTPLYASPVLLPDGYVMGWQDISTAPIGTYALLFSERDRDISIRDFGQFAKYNSPKFTHWMPLPQLPIGTGEGR